MKTIKPIALYLPQFHAIPENDKWWGKGFTEWVNVKKARPLFKGHYEPREPLNDNYYNLNDVSVMTEQAKLARKYGIYGFCYYHYWFGNGKKLLEKPIEQMLVEKEVDIPFCLSWANENWSRNWDGGNREVIMPQDYGDESTWIKHIEYLLQFFRDERYIRVDDRPVLLVYKPFLIPEFNKMIRVWNEYLKANNEKKLLVYSQYPFQFEDPDKYDLDGIVKFEPFFAASYLKSNNPLYRIYKKHIIMNAKKINGVTVRDYDRTWDFILNKEPKGGKYIPGAFADWDNTRRKATGVSYRGANPRKFAGYFKELTKQVLDGSYDSEFIFINAWNEWAEGTYLEPDKKYGYGYLKAIKNALYGKEKEDA